MVELYLDVRMGGEVATIYAIKPSLEQEFYEKGNPPLLQLLDAPG